MPVHGFKYRPFHKTLPRSIAFLNWNSVRFCETDCMASEENNNRSLIHTPPPTDFDVNELT